MKSYCLNLLILFTIFELCISRRYDNFTLFSATPTEEYHLNFLQNLVSEKYIDVIFWKKPSKLYNDVHFIVNPMDIELFKERTRHFKLQTQILLRDVQSAFDSQSMKKYVTPKIESFNWEYYHTLEDIYQWMSDLAVQNPERVELRTIGQSVEGRDIQAVLIKKDKGRANVIVDGGMHGNEWISTVFVTFLIQKLVHAKNEDDILYDLANKYHWYLIPVVNPDGFDYSIKHDRLWRKNRRIFSTGEGVDLNRNFQHNFGKYGTSANVKDDNYGGREPFSEPESKALAGFITSKRDRLKFYISFHAYGQKIIIPYDDRVQHVENFSEMDNYAKQAILRMYRLNGVKYGVGTTYDTLGLRASGSSTTWVKKSFKTKYVITFLLRDNGSYGYALPNNQIKPTCEETLQGLIELMTARPRRIRSDLFNAAQKLENKFVILTLVYFLIFTIIMLIAFRTVIVYLVTIFPFDECAQKKYHNHTLYRAIPMSEKHLKFFKDLNQFYDVNYWRPPGKISKSVEFIISPEDKPAFTKDAEHLGIYLVTIMDNVQRAFDGQTVRSYVRRKMEQFDWRSYFKTIDIYKWLFDLGNEYPQEVYLESIGKTLENRDIIAVRILLGTGKRRPKVIVEGGIHAREWISPAFVTYMMNQILHAPKSNNTALKEIAFAYEWYFVPILNPDGYEITHTSDRLWRKNSRGVDLNRNFGIAFGTVGVSFSSWDNSYCGDHAFSERESSSMASFVRSKSEDLEYYLAFHSYGQYMIIPYTFTKKHLENYDEVYAMGKKAALRIADKHGTGYTVGTAFDTVGYLTSGVSGCWVKKTFKVPYVMTFELRDEGYYGFALPPADILPTCEETMDGVLSLLSPTQRKLSQAKGGQGHNILDTLVTAWNIVLFILVRYG
ncbi:PREDICTED: uncharacterized protein LOC106119901 [Papilio xuthus]|uniref:Uncharacterized protein LOC106119901 n=1 Tax=Papilio xuthus TaxID=66420 RepID=A0AAJ7EBC1_PAPXU|nr:PREDICTED: uncharacterized protein LOC106119901 [Papilio xuthus]